MRQPLGNLTNWLGSCYRQSNLWCWMAYYCSKSWRQSMCMLSPLIISHESHAWCRIRAFTFCRWFCFVIIIIICTHRAFTPLMSVWLSLRFKWKQHQYSNAVQELPDIPLFRILSYHLDKICINKVLQNLSFLFYAINCALVWWSDPIHLHSFRCITLPTDPFLFL